jgi:CRP-like cAMP-binding protein
VRAALDLVGAVADMGAEAGPGEHFGELAARDWGGGYGYARTATVQCAQDGQLLQLSSDDFQWLVQTQPAARTELAKVLADRLRQR